ncbi:hypothetical protein TNCV_1014361 [Trichonephila clavipes]|uniref:Uncharacterized protein n=1 Tax=Trichonephila clavipes TaxID=2585209 RepID=A0A8X6VXP3_TRICX|nr:hypothetical protein TNCV_1014361 [Trichonephila clavipes]
MGCILAVTKPLQTLQVPEPESHLMMALSCGNSHYQFLTLEFLQFMLSLDAKYCQDLILRIVPKHVHDNAPGLTALMVRQFLSNNSIVIVLQPHPPYSLNLVHQTFFVSMNGKSEREMIQCCDEVKENTVKALNSILVQEFQNCFEV